MKITFLGTLPPLPSDERDPKVIDLTAHRLQKQADDIAEKLENGGEIKLRDKDGKLQTVHIKGLSEF